LHKRDGFGTRKHQPDFAYEVGGKIYCVEIELTPKSKDRTIKILSDNFMDYEKQMWVVPNSQTKIRKILRDNETAYPNIEVIAFETVTDYIKARANKNE
jgi:DNA-dependent RNA polymerase auxiliary subunit epsilon